LALGHTFELVAWSHFLSHAESRLGFELLQHSDNLFHAVQRVTGGNRRGGYLSTCCQLLRELALEWNAHRSAGASAPHLECLEVSFSLVQLAAQQTCLSFGASLCRVAASHSAGQVEVGGSK
jgi:hypothetical protein